VQSLIQERGKHFHEHSCLKRPFDLNTLTDAEKGNAGKGRLKSKVRIEKEVQKPTLSSPRKENNGTALMHL
jgi:hypothetical protein